MDSIVEKTLEKGVIDGIYPGAVLLAAVSDKVIFHYSVGFSQIIPYPIRMRKDTIFDLASLTKPLATTLVIMKLVSNGIVDLDTHISDIIKVPVDKQHITIRMLLSHSSGLPAWRPYYLRLINYPVRLRKDIVINWILKETLLFSPGEGALYSDLGFILLEAIINKVIKGDIKSFLAQLYSDLFLDRTFLGYFHKKTKKEEFAATEFCEWRKRIIQAEVHDENAFALGGYSGHAGLFSTAKDIFVICNNLLKNYSGKVHLFKVNIIKEFFKKHNKRWALGWDTPTYLSSSGSFFSENSIGHLGFTGTSIWIDLHRNITIILLTNRIHPSRKNEKIKSFRSLIHDLIMQKIC